VIHVYFLAILHEILVKVRNTGFYQQHRKLVDQWTRLATNTAQTLVSTTRQTHGKADDQFETPTLFNYRIDNWYLDNKADGQCHQVDAIQGNGYPAFKFWLMLTTEQQHQQLLSEAAVAWQPNFRFDVEHVVVNSTLRK
jgi:hypothetical protein